MNSSDGNCSETPMCRARRTLVSHGGVHGPKKLKYLSNACLTLGFLIPFLASNFVGMSLSAMPLVSVATIVLWIVGLLVGYFAYLEMKKPPATLSFRMRIGNYISSEP